MQKQFERMSLGATPAKAAAPEESEEDEEVEPTEICSVKGSLFLIDAEGKMALKAAEVRAVLAQAEQFSFELQIVTTAGRPVMRVAVDADMQMRYEKGNGGNGMTWLTRTETAMHAWHFVCADDAGARDTFRLRLAQALAETARQEKFSDICEEGDKYTLSTLEEEDAKQSDEKDDAQWDPEATPTKVRKGGRFSGEYNSADDDSDVPNSPDDANKNLTVGTANNRTYVVRGSKLGVFKQDENDDLVFLNKIPKIQTRGGELFVPSEMILHDRDNTALFLNPDDTKTMYMMDLERGEIVSEMNVKQDFNVRNFNPLRKYAQRTTEQTFTALGKNYVATVDPRLSGKDKAGSMFTYTKNVGFSCVATNGLGQMACGTDKGEIMLFTQPGQRAKVNLPGLGDPIIGIDVTETGDFVLATTEHYLLIVKTDIGDGSGKTGFEKAMGKGKKPAPIKLQLRHMDIINYGIFKVKFTRAYFNTGVDIKEKWIVAATGHYIITWNFDKIKKGIAPTDCYQIKKTSDDVVDNKFFFGKEDKVVIGLKDNIQIEKRVLKARSGAA